MVRGAVRCVTAFHSVALYSTVYNMSQKQKSDDAKTSTFWLLFLLVFNYKMLSKVCTPLKSVNAYFVMTTPKQTKVLTKILYSIKCTEHLNGTVHTHCIHIVHRIENVLKGMAKSFPYLLLLMSKAQSNCAAFWHKLICHLSEAA